MAEFLIKAIDAHHPDSKIDLAGCYKTGDVILAQPDGWSWGKEECLPKFIILKVPGMTVESAQEYLKSYTELEPNDLVEEVKVRRAQKINMSSLGIKDSIAEIQDIHLCISTKIKGVDFEIGGTE